MNNDIAISVKNLSKRYFLQHPVQDEHGHKTNELWALKDVSFDIKKGESVGIIGPNGSGKTTLLKILAGITKPTSGSVEINGRVASILDIGAGFHPELSGRENVFLNGQLLGFREREIKVKFDEIVAFSGIEKFIDQPVKNYSNGMYLRLAFSIMVHLDFDVYLLDEVMSVGDAEFVMNAKRELQQLAKSTKTVLLASHNMVELNNQNFFILLENGCFISTSTDVCILTEYFESRLQKGGKEAAKRNVEITNFSQFPISSELSVVKIALKQDGDEDFRTDKPFIFEVVFDKLTNTDIIELVLSVSDIHENVVLSTTPLLSCKSTNVENGRYTYECTIPANIFGFQTYNIVVFFVKNADVMFGDKSSIISTSNIVNIINSTYVLHNIFSFKPKLMNQNGEIGLGKLNINGGLLPIFNWKLMINTKR